MANTRLIVKNWDKFQHYRKKRGPAWIKIYTHRVPGSGVLFAPGSCKIAPDLHLDARKFAGICRRFDAF
jgi:hypothetical protein